MDSEPQTKTVSNPRLGMITGSGIVAGILACKGVEKLLTPSLGELGAWGVGFLVAVVVAPAVGLLVARLMAAVLTSEPS